MRSIHSKITMVLIIVLFVQILITGTFYQLALTKKIIYEINNNSNTRQSMLSDVVKRIEGTGNLLPQIQTYLLQYSQNHNIDFKMKDMKGNIVYLTAFTNNMSGKIEDRAFVEFKGLPTYVIFAYFPTKMNSILGSVRGNDTKAVLAVIIGVIGVAASFIIYLLIGAPLKKLRKEMVGIDYGNTEVKIPYYAKDEIGLLCRNIEEMGQRLKGSEESQHQLIQAISHDLKTPLTSILGYITRLCDGKVNSEEKRAEYYDIIRRKTLDLKYLIGELSDFSNISGEVRFDMNKAPFNDFFDDILQEFYSDASRSGKQVLLTSKIEQTVYVMMDESMLRRVFTNIWSNSIKYAGEEATVKITAETENQGNYVRIEIGDNGTGVLVEHLDKIFGRFYRVETSRSREKGGTGLGLAICKDIIEGHGGRIWAENNAEGGLSILFTLPVVR